MKETKNNLTDTLRVAVAGLFAIAILAGSFVLFLQIKKQNEPLPETQDNEELKKEIDSLNGQIEQLNNELKNTNTTSKSTVVVKSEQVDESEAQSSTKISPKVNINTASASELDELPGIGATYAKRIVDYREGHGGFKNIEEIKNVQGIGDATFSKIKDSIEI